MQKLSRRTVLQAAAATTLLNSRLASAAGDQPRPPNAQNLLWYTTVAQQWVEALPVGNGRLGAMIFGGTDRERLQLNEDTLWAGGPYDPANPEARSALPEVRKLVFDGEYEKASELANAKLMGKPMRQPSYQTIGDLRLTFPGLQRAGNYRRTLDLDGALATTQFTSDGVTHVREVFASAPDNVLVIRLTASKPRHINANVTFHWPAPARPANPPGPNQSRRPVGTGPGSITFDDEASAPADLILRVLPDGDLIMQGRNTAHKGIAGALTYEARARLIVSGGQRESKSSVVVRDADSVLILVSMATSYRDYEHVDADPAARNR